MTNVSSTPSPAEENDQVPAADTGSKDDTPISDNEKSLLAKVSEVGEDAVKRIKDIISEVDTEELKKSLNKDKIRHSLAATLDSLNHRVQGLLVPKGEHGTPEKWEPTPIYNELDAAETSNESNTVGPVGSETIVTDAEAEVIKDETPAKEEVPAKEEAPAKGKKTSSK